MFVGPQSGRLHNTLALRHCSDRNSEMLSPAIRRWIETPTGTLSLAAIPLAFALFKILQKLNVQRLSKVLKNKQRVLVLGATSGIRRSIARQYSERGAVVFVVGRRRALVNEVVKEYRQARSSLRDVFRLLTEFWEKGSTSPACLP